jgi:DNA-binding NtrC family response regulator
MTAPPPQEKDSARHGWRPSVLVLDDEWSVLERVKASLSDGYEVKVSSRAQDAVQIMSSQSFDVVLTDLRMPDMDGLSLVSEMKARYPDTQYILMTAFSDIEDTISAIRLGVADYLRKPFTVSEVRHALSRCLEQRKLRREVARLQAGGGLSLGDIIARNGRMRETLKLANTVAATDVTVLINGETGTGKGLVARAMHHSSPRRDRPYVEINCAAIPASLIESELFGHERGAFTGAVARKIGRVETAHTGTLLLDEVGEMPLEMQAKLLTFLQEFSFERVGGTKKNFADVRVIAATNRDLHQAVEEGGFRRDLFYRLHVIHLDLPPLRLRPEDIPLLAQHFLERFSLKYGKQMQGFSPQAQEQLMSHPWPGNVRELENALERAVILSRSAWVARLDLGEAIQVPGYANPALLTPPPPAAGAEPRPGRIAQTLAQYLAECEKGYLADLLRDKRGSIQDTAQAAAVDPKTLYLKMKRHGISRREYRRPPASRRQAAAGKPPEPAGPEI